MNIYEELLVNGDEVRDTYSDIVMAEGLFILGDFKYFVTYEEFNDLEFGHFGLMSGFIRKYTDVLNEYEKNHKQMCIVEGYYDFNTIAFINDNANKTLWGLDKNEEEDIDSMFDDLLSSSNIDSVKNNSLKKEKSFNEINSLFKPATLADKEKAAPILLQKLNVKKVYALYIPDNNKMKRLAKLLKKKK